jgi:hypothetical protein
MSTVERVGLASGFPLPERVAQDSEGAIQTRSAAATGLVDRVRCHGPDQLIELVGADLQYVAVARGVHPVDEAFALEVEQVYILQSRGQLVAQE